MPSLDEIFKQMPNAALAYLKDQKLDEIECVIADLPGIARGKAVPVSYTHLTLPTILRV